MDDLEFYRFTHTVLRNAANAAPDLTQRKHLGILREEAWKRMRFAEQRTPLVFAPHAGYVWIGNKGFEQACAHPGHPGIDEAWAILLHGATAGSVLHASDFGGSGNALHGRLKTASEWVKDATGCFDLADYIGAIKVGRNGSITPPPITRRIEFHL